MFGIVQNRPKIPPVETTAFLFLVYEKLSKDWRLSVAAKSELSNSNSVPKQKGIGISTNPFSKLPVTTSFQLHFEPQGQSGAYVK